MEILNKLFLGKGYIDGITIINLDGEILFTAKFNDKLTNKSESSDLLGKNFFEVYENLSTETSTTYRAMQTGMPVYIENQYLKSKGQRGIVITSLSVPIKRGNRLVGVIDLSVQENVEEKSKQNTKIELETNELSENNLNSLNRRAARFELDDIIAVDEHMQQVKNYIKVVATCDLPVMIYGETGTGKEVFAQAIHNCSKRRDKPFIAQNCAAIPDTLLESILFGTAKGAFTGALENKGLLELANGGTLFLDEINSMPTNLQSKLLRVLQDGTFRSLGSSNVKSTDVKIITALNTEPLKAIESGQLRRDIYYRLSMMAITIPPLRMRKKDIQSFVEVYVKKHNTTFGKKICYISNVLLEKLMEYDWPGNIRELEHLIVYGMSMVNENSDTLKYEDIEEKFNQMLQARIQSTPELSLCTSLSTAVNEFESKLIENTLKKANGNISVAAKILNVPRQTLQRKLKRL